MKYHETTVKKLCDLIEAGNTQKDAAIIAGVSEATVCEWKKSKPEFLERLLKAESTSKAQMIAVVRRHAFGLDGVAVRWQAAAWWLERKYSAEFALKWQGELSGRNGKPLIPEGKPTVDLSRLTDDQLKAMGTNLAAVIKSAKEPEAHANGNGNGNGNGSAG